METNNVPPVTLADKRSVSLIQEEMGKLIHVSGTFIGQLDYVGEVLRQTTFDGDYEELVKQFHEAIAKCRASEMSMMNEVACAFNRLYDATHKDEQ